MSANIYYSIINFFITMVLKTNFCGELFFFTIKHCLSFLKSLNFKFLVEKMSFFIFVNSLHFYLMVLCENILPRVSQKVTIVASFLRSLIFLIVFWRYEKFLKTIVKYHCMMFNEREKPRTYCGLFYGKCLVKIGGKRILEMLNIKEIKQKYLKKIFWSNQNNIENKEIGRKLNICF